MKGYRYKPIKLKQLEDSRKSMEESRKTKQQARIMAGLPIMKMDEVEYNSPCLEKENEGFLELREKKPKENLHKMYHSRMSIAAMESIGKHKVTWEHDKRVPMKDIEVVADLIGQVERNDKGDQFLRRSFKDLLNGVTVEHHRVRGADRHHYRKAGHRKPQNNVSEHAPAGAAANSSALESPSRLGSISPPEGFLRKSEFSPIEHPERPKSDLGFVGNSDFTDESGNSLNRSTSKELGLGPPPLRTKKWHRNLGSTKHSSSMDFSNSSLPSLMHQYLHGGGGKGGRNVESSPTLPSLSPQHRRQLHKTHLDRADRLVAMTHVHKPLQRQEVMMVVNFMDKDGDGEINIEEFVNALREAKQHNLGDVKLEDIFHRIDDVLRLEHLRASDLFSKFDLDGGGSLSREELMEGLSVLCDVSRVKILEVRKHKRLLAEQKRKAEEEKRQKAISFLSDLNSLPHEVMGDHEYFHKNETGTNFDRILARVSADEFKDLNTELQEILSLNSSNEGSSEADLDKRTLEWRQEKEERKKRFLDKFGSCNDEETKLLKQTFFEEELLPNLFKERGKRTAFGYYVKDEGDIVRRTWMRISKEKPLG